MVRKEIVEGPSLRLVQSKGRLESERDGFPQNTPTRKKKENRSSAFHPPPPALLFLHVCVCVAATP